MRKIALASVVWLVGYAYGCGGTNNSSGFGSGDDGGGGFGDDGGVFNGDGSFSNGDGGGTGPNQNCSAAAMLVYVLSAENDLYSFNPPSKQFKKIGTLGCQTNMTPNSMAVDRNANAWVNYAQADMTTGMDTGGAIFKVSTADASCQPTSIHLSQNWYRLGMGFSTDTANGTSETLYVAATGSMNPFGMGGASPGLGKIDLKAQSLAPIGGFGGALDGQNAELTGTGDARLFGFFTTTPVQIAQIDKSSGAANNAKPLNGVETPSYWAFSFWGGDFYLYTADKYDMANPFSSVTRFRPTDGSVTVLAQNIGFRVVGAGVSTCAPTTPPR